MFFGGAFAKLGHSCICTGMSAVSVLIVSTQMLPVLVRYVGLPTLKFAQVVSTGRPNHGEAVAPTLKRLPGTNWFEFQSRVSMENWYDFTRSRLCIIVIIMTYDSFVKK